MKKAVKNSIIIAIYRLMVTAKLKGIEAKGKYDVLRLCNDMKPVATAYDDFQKDAQERLKEEGHKEKEEEARELMKQYKDKTASELPEDVRKRYDELNAYFGAYQQRVDDCCKEQYEAETEIDMQRLTRDTFGKLMEANEDWTLGQIMQLEQHILKPEAEAVKPAEA